MTKWLHGTQHCHAECGGDLKLIDIVKCDELSDQKKTNNCCKCVR